MHKPNKAALTCLFAYCVLVKVLPFILMHFGMDIRAQSIYPWSFTPLFAFGIFGVSRFRDWKLAFGLPMLAYLVSDILIGILTSLKYGSIEGMSYLFYPGQFFQYGALIACIYCGVLLRNSSNWLKIGAVAMIGPTLFFLISNFGVWKFDIGIGYARDLAGLMQCYVAGIPFYINQLISTLGFSVLLFSPVGQRTVLQPDRVPNARTIPASNEQILSR